MPALVSCVRTETKGLLNSKRTTAEARPTLPPIRSLEPDHLALRFERNRMECLPDGLFLLSALQHELPSGRLTWEALMELLASLLDERRYDICHSQQQSEEASRLRVV